MEEEDGLGVNMRSWYFARPFHSQKVLCLVGEGVRVMFGLRVREEGGR